MIFNELTSGASDDIKRATELAHRMVTDFGMSDKLGPRTFGDKQELVFLGREIGTEQNYSEAIAKAIDEEVYSFIDRAHKAAQKIVATRRKALEAIAKELLRKEVIEQDDFYALIKPFNLKPLAV